MVMTFFDIEYPRNDTI